MQSCYKNYTLYDIPVVYKFSGLFVFITYMYGLMNSGLLHYYVLCLINRQDYRKSRCLSKLIYNLNDKNIYVYINIWAIVLLK